MECGIYFYFSGLVILWDVSEEYGRYVSGLVTIWVQSKECWIDFSDLITIIIDGMFEWYKYYFKFKLRL